DIDKVPGHGIGYTWGAQGEPFLFDLDSVLGCADGVADFQFAYGPCAQPAGGFSTYISLLGLPVPIDICVRGIDQRSGGIDLTILDLSLDAARFSMPGDQTVMSQRFDSGIPSRLDIPGLGPATSYRFEITVTDGNTVPVTAQSTFVYQGERYFIFSFGSAPLAAIVVGATYECDRVGGVLVPLDGTSSTDPDSSPGTQDDIASYEWFEDHGG